MTTLPKHLEEMRQFWIDTYELDNRKTYSAVSYIYRIDYPLEFVRPAKIIQVIEKSAVDIMLKDMESMAKALEKIANATREQAIQHSDAPWGGSFNGLQNYAREALKNYREKYGVE